MENIESYIVELMKKVEGKEPEAKGNNKQCYYIDGYALLKHSAIESEKLKQVIEIQSGLKDKGVNVCTTLGFVIDKEDTDKELKSGYILQERADGKPMHKYSNWNITEQEAEEIRNEYVEELEQLKGENQVFYDKFVSDWIAIIKSGLKVDPKINNFYYQKGKSINFIDLELGTENCEKIDMNRVCMEMAVVLADGTKYYNRQIVPENEIRKRINVILTQVFKKLSSSLEKQGMNRVEISETIKNRFPEIDIDTKDWIKQAQEQTNGKSRAQIEIEKEQRDAEARLRFEGLIHSAVQATKNIRETKISEQEGKIESLQQGRENRDLTDEEKRERSKLLFKKQTGKLSPEEQLRLEELNRQFQRMVAGQQQGNKKGQGMGR